MRDCNRSCLEDLVLVGEYENENLNFGHLMPSRSKPMWLIWPNFTWKHIDVYFLHMPIIMLPLC